MTLHAYVDKINFLSSAAKQDARGWGALPGIDFGEGGQLSGSARIGWAEINADEPEFADFADIVGRAQLAYRPNRRLTLRLNGIREPGFTTSEGSIYYLDTRTGLRGVYYLNRILGIEVGGSVARLTFPGSASTEPRIDTTDAWDVGLRFRLAENDVGRRVEFSVRMKRYERESTAPGQNRSRTTIGFGADMGF